MDSRTVLIRSALIRLALVLSALSVIIVLGSRVEAEPRSEHGGIQFDVQCQRAGEGVEGLSCAVVVSGLPEPLQDQVSVLLSTPPLAPSDLPGGDVDASTLSASEAPPLAAPGPTLLNKQLALPRPAPAETALHVPQPPPKAV